MYLRPAGAERTPDRKAREQSLLFEQRLLTDLIRSRDNEALTMARRSRNTPKIDLTPAVLHTTPPSPEDPPEHYVMCWLDRVIATMVALANGDPPPSYELMPPPGRRKGRR